MCFLLAVVPACFSSKPKPLSKEQRELLEEQAMAKWKKTQQQMLQDGYGKTEVDGEIIWKKKVKKKKFKILNRKQLNKSVIKGQQVQ